MYLHGHAPSTSQLQSCRERQASKLSCRGLSPALKSSIAYRQASTQLARSAQPLLLWRAFALRIWFFPYCEYACERKEVRLLPRLLRPLFRFRRFGNSKYPVFFLFRRCCRNVQTLFSKTYIAYNRFRRPLWASQFSFRPTYREASRDLRSSKATDARADREYRQAIP